MSGENGIEIPTTISEALIQYRDGKISPTVRFMLMSWIQAQMNKDLAFDATELAKKRFQFTDERAVDLKKAIDKFAIRSPSVSMDETTAKTLARAEKERFAEFVKIFWEQAHAVATDLVIRSAERAKEMGYWDGELKMVDVKKFLEDALRFFLENKDQVDDLVADRDHYKALSDSLIEQMRPKYTYLYLVKVYTHFLAQMQQLEASGYPVPAFVVEEVQNTINQTYRKLEELQAQVVGR